MIKVLIGIILIPFALGAILVSAGMVVGVVKGVKKFRKE
jgi:hypothetical protein